MARPDPALLVVDDNEDNRYTLVQRLNRRGYSNLTTAVNGREALDLLHARPFDLVLLEVTMPEMYGYEVLEHLKSDARLRHVPVVMIPAVDQMESVVRCIELGAEDYLPKPFNPTLLRARVRASLEKKRLRDELEAHAARIEADLESAIPARIRARGPSSGEGRWRRLRDACDGSVEVASATGSDPLAADPRAHPRAGPLVR